MTKKMNLDAIANLKLRNPIRGRKLSLVVPYGSLPTDLKLRNPIRGRKLLQINYYNYNFLVFEIKKPHKGTETQRQLLSIKLLSYLKLRNPIRGRKL